MEPTLAISSHAKNVEYRLQKHGRLSEIEPDRFGVAGGYVTSPRRAVEELVRSGAAKFDKLGDVVLIRPLTKQERGRP